MKIIIDSREQNPYTFGDYPAEVIPGTLQTGDYSLHGFDRPAGGIAIERKELPDLLGCLTHDRERFLRELDRLMAFQTAALVIEAPLSLIRAHCYRSRITPEAAEQSLVSIMANYRLPVYFAMDRADGEKFVYDFLRHFHRHAEAHYKACFAGSGGEPPGNRPEGPPEGGTPRGTPHPGRVLSREGGSCEVEGAGLTLR